MSAKSKRTVDTSVVVAGLCTWHPDHEVSRGQLADRPIAIAHVMVEAYSVLTRLPGRRRVSPDMAIRAIARAFPQPAVGLAEEALLPLLKRLPGLGIFGGATYDALVAETARLAGMPLISLDARAQRTYDALGATVIML